MRSWKSGVSVTRAFELWIVATLLVMMLGCAQHLITPDTYSASWEQVCYSSFAEDVSDLVGPSALDCGMVRLDDSNRMQARKQACARKVVASGRPFKLGYVGVGDDSLFCDVAGRSSDGQLWHYFFDFDVTGQNGRDGSNSSLRMSRCEQIEFTPGTIYAGSFFKLSECKEAPDVAKRYVR
jgi:hypothetical protein